MFYSYVQNNSGGNFIGKHRLIIIEASTAEEANNKALLTDIYFDGVDDGIDCDCCGDRWYRCGQSEGDKVPSLHGISLLNRKFDESMQHWSPAIIYFKDGTQYEVTKEITLLQAFMLERKIEKDV
jgi:hypothetical protein